jgi:hypothetical protein
LPEPTDDPDEAGSEDLDGPSGGTIAVIVIIVIAVVAVAVGCAVRVLRRKPHGPLEKLEEIDPATGTVDAFLDDELIPD